MSGLVKKITTHPAVQYSTVQYNAPCAREYGVPSVLTATTGKYGGCGKPFGSRPATHLSEALWNLTHESHDLAVHQVHRHLPVSKIGPLRTLYFARMVLTVAKPPEVATVALYPYAQDQQSYIIFQDTVQSVKSVMQSPPALFFCHTLNLSTSYHSGGHSLREGCAKPV